MSQAKAIPILILAALLGCARDATVQTALTASVDPADAEVLAATEEPEWRQSPLFERALEGPLDAILYLAPPERVSVTTPTAP